MKLGRLILVATLLLVAGLGFWFAVARWEDANKVASVLSAVAGVAAVGVALWAVLRSPATPQQITVTGTGRAESRTDDANTGVQAGSVPSGQPIEVKDTGD